ncbi:MAG: hypothetical protein ACPG7F_05395 [Aggregatilineales bacterium]
MSIASEQPANRLFSRLFNILFLWTGLGAFSIILFVGNYIAQFTSPLFLIAIAGLSLPLLVMMVVIRFIKRLSILLIPCLILSVFLIGVSFYYLDLNQVLQMIIALTGGLFAVTWLLAAPAPFSFQRFNRVLMLLSLILIWAGTTIVLFQAPSLVAGSWILATLICLTILLYESCQPFWQQQQLMLKTFSGMVLLLCGIAFQIGLLLQQLTGV